MEDKIKIKEDVEELSKNIKIVFLIYDHVRNTSKNIDEFNPSKIVLTKDIKKKSLAEVFILYKNHYYQQLSNVNNKTRYFIDLMEKIMSYDYMPNVCNTQLLLIYNLIYIFHKYTSPEDSLKFQKSYSIILSAHFINYEHYSNILKDIGLIKEDNEDNTDIEFFNACKIIQNLNRFEFNSSISTFLLLKE